ncbi:phosphodiesterase [Thalassospira sp. MA62]|nr:phosphodiesterase [Thalassospira sp. MA62]
MLIAQLTDLHIGAGRRLAYRKVDTAGALERAVARVNAMMPRPDMVLFTGDIGDLGTADEYALVADILHDLDVPFYMIPGNHDQRAPLRAAFPDAMPIDDGMDYINYVIDAGPVRLIGLDSLDEGQPEGKLCCDRLDWLERTLNDGDDRPCVLFIHHPPVNVGIAHMDKQRLLTGDRTLAQIVSARKERIHAILCGHVHRPIHTRWAGVPLIIAPSIAHQVALDLNENGPSAFAMEPPAMYLHRWDTDQNGLMTHLAYIDRYDGPYPFFDENGKLIV